MVGPVWLAVPASGRNLEQQPRMRSRSLAANHAARVESDYPLRQPWGFEQGDVDVGAPGVDLAYPPLAFVEELESPAAVEPIGDEPDRLALAGCRIEARAGGQHEIAGYAHLGRARVDRADAPVARVDEAETGGLNADLLAARRDLDEILVGAGHGEQTTPEPAGRPGRTADHLRVGGRVEPVEQPRQGGGRGLGLVVGDGEVREVDLADQIGTDHEGAAPAGVDGQAGDALLNLVARAGQEL